MILLITSASFKCTARPWSSYRTYFIAPNRQKLWHQVIKLFCNVGLKYISDDRDFAGII